MVHNDFTTLLEELFFDIQYGARGWRLACCLNSVMNYERVCLALIAAMESLDPLKDLKFNQTKKFGSFVSTRGFEKKFGFGLRIQALH